MARSRMLVLCSAVLFGTTGTAQALGAAGASPLAVGALRLLVGAVGLQCAARLLGSRARPARGARGARGAHGAHGARGQHPPTAAAPWLRPRTWLAGLAVAAYQPAFFLGVRTTGVAVGTVVALGSAPVLTGALAWACGHGRPGRRWAAATGLAALGLAVLAASGSAGRVHPLGILLALGAGAAYAVFTVTMKADLDAGSRIETTLAAAFTTGAVLLGPLLLVVPLGRLASPAGAATVLWLGTGPTALAYLLFGRGLRGLAAAEVSTLTLAEPVTAAALGILVLGESISAASAVGATLILVGLATLAAGAGEEVAGGERSGHDSGRRRDSGPAAARAGG